MLARSVREDESSRVYFDRTRAYSQRLRPNDDGSEHGQEHRSKQCK